MTRCPHCGHTSGGEPELFAATADGPIPWRLLMWTALFIAAVVLILAGVHAHILGP